MQVNGGDEKDRTSDLGIANAALSQLSYVPIGQEPGGAQSVSGSKGMNMVSLVTGRGDEGDRTPDLQTASLSLSQLSYVPNILSQRSAASFDTVILVLCPSCVQRLRSS